MPDRKSLVAFCLFVFAFALVARAQDDSPSLGDVARQARQQKQKEAQPQSVAGKTDNDKANINKVDNDKTESNQAPAQDAQSVQTPTEASKDVQEKAGQSKNVQNQNKDAQGTAGSVAQPSKAAKHIITNDEIPSHVGPTGYRPQPGQQTWNPLNQPAEGQPGAGGPKLPASYWTQQIQNQKNLITSLQSQIGQISDSIQYAGGNCVSGCVQWNEHQKQKQDQVESMKAQLEEAQKRLEDMQDMARTQGYGSSVYDP